MITYANEVNRHCTEECPKLPYYYYKDKQNHECTQGTFFLRFRLPVSLLWWRFNTIMCFCLCDRLLSSFVTPLMQKMPRKLFSLCSIAQLYLLCAWIIFTFRIMPNRMSEFPRAILQKWSFEFLRLGMFLTIFRILGHWKMLNKLSINLL